MLAELDRTHGTAGNRIHYLAVPPQAFPVVVREIGERRAREPAGCASSSRSRSVATSPRRRSSPRRWRRWFAEDEIFRIDHYLGKETVQNMLALRFANGIFEPIWNRQFVDHVQITVAESIGIEGRGGLLRAGRRAPRHRPEPPAAAASR